ncbi:hypothetical protein [Amycolatopsis sp. NPDC004079]|uniref:hypothetical protein n=1 Tax=Amycolatopsis sp. NPDC004079 TaxID=3154549 RepID=UPI0033BF1302
MGAKMIDKHSFRSLLHRATHRVPGIPAHVEKPAGHQGAPLHGDDRAPRRPRNRNRNHSTARPPRVLASWQRRIAVFFGQELS